ncbi:MAG: putative DNA-binding domain-containing protein [Oceanospirillaceae bacterium]|nr:putative DNA-binding domain-containing protein [Oceanospirillaceae bacterium]
MLKTTNLAQLQGHFVQSLQHGLLAHTLDQSNPSQVAHLNNLLVDSHFTPEQLISVYRNNFLISLKELLEQLFPVTNALIGGAYFAYVSRQFIAENPLIQPHLNQYGGEFVDFLMAVAPLKKMPFVAQMAELEWHLDRIGHLYHKTKFDFDRLSQIDESQVMGIHFNLAPTCYLMSSDINLIELHKRLSNPDQSISTDIIDAAGYQQQSYILVLQNQHGDSALMSLNHQHWRWLKGLKCGLSLSQLCGVDDTDLQLLMNQVADWIALGCIDGFAINPN